MITLKRFRAAFFATPLVFFICSGFVSAQDVGSDFPQVSKADLLQTKYEQDTTASAAILFDQGETFIDAVTTTNRYTRIKIYNKDGLKWGNVTFYTGSNQAAKIKAVSHYFDPVANRIISTEMKDDAIFRTRVSKRTDKVTFTIPNLKSGVIIEYKYTVKLVGSFIPRWAFQYTIPVKYSEYLMLTATARYLRSKLVGQLELTKFETKYKSVYDRWLMKNVPALDQEPLMPDERVYRSAMFFWDASIDWGDYAYGLTDSPDFWRIVVGNPWLSKVATEITKGLTDEKDKIKAICYYVKQNIQWNGTSDFWGDDPKELLKRTTGSSGEINILLAALLRKAGVNVSLVLLSTRDNGLIFHDYPSISQFNRTLCMVDGPNAMLLDATEKLLPYNIIPEECLNYDGLIVGDQAGWADISPTAWEKITQQADLKLSPQGILDGTISRISEGYSALDVRQVLSKKTTDEYISDFSVRNNYEISSSSFEDVAELEKPVKEKHEVTLPGRATTNGDFIYVNPYVSPLDEVSYFVTDKRQFPIDFGIPHEQIFITSIIIPDGYEVDEIPRGEIFRLNDNGAMCIFDIQRLQNRITFTTKFQRAKMMFLPKDYVELREFYNRIVAKYSEQLVLKKLKG